jgi:arsenite methyltransferase
MIMKKYLQEVALDKEFVDFFDEVPLWSAPFGLKLLDKINYRKGISAIDIGF